MRHKSVVPVGDELSASELRGVQLAILEDVATYCNEHGFEYQLGWGTLLGAVRHGGFIPWDDDIDLVMPREDYDRFCCAFRSQVGNRVLAKPLVRDWPYPFAKVVNDSTVVIEDSAHHAQLGVNIDIFPMDLSRNSHLLKHVQSFLLSFARSLLVLRLMTRREGRNKGKAIVQAVASLMTAPIPAGVFVHLLEWSAKNFPGTAGPQRGVRVGPRDWLVDASAVEPGECLLFEGRRFAAPKDPAATLTAIYGDFMRLPPVEQRVTMHRFTAYWAA